MDPQHPFHPDEKEGQLKLNCKRQVTYRLWQPGKPRRLLLMLHGMGSNMTRWSEFVAHTELKESLDLLRLDLRGHGYSSCRCPVSMERWAWDLHQILEAEGYTSAVIAGHSMGALLALHFARLYPLETDALVLVEPSFPETMEKNRRWLGPVFRGVASAIRGLNILGLHRRSYRYRSLWEWDEQAREMIRSGRHDEMIAKYSSPWVDLPYNPLTVYFQDAAEILRKAPVSSEISQPVLTLLSTHMEGELRNTMNDILSGLKNNLTVEVPASHWIMTEAPDLARQEIESFLLKKRLNQRLR